MSFRPLDDLLCPMAKCSAGAVAMDRVLITSDTDFGELVFRDSHAAVGVVLIRLDIVSDALAAKTAQRIVALENNARGLFVVLESANERQRPLTD